MGAMQLLVWLVLFPARLARLVGTIVIPRLVRFANRAKGRHRLTVERVAEGAGLVARIIFQLWTGRPSLAATAPRWAFDSVRLAALAAVLLYLELFRRVAPPVAEALRSPDPWTLEGLAVLLIVAWLVVTRSATAVWPFGQGVRSRRVPAHGFPSDTDRGEVDASSAWAGRRCGLMDDSRSEARVRRLPRGIRSGTPRIVR